jgi:hypothetical protein
MISQFHWLEPGRFGTLCVAVLFAATLLVLYLRSARRLGKYRARQLLTDNELEFLYRIIKAVPGYLVFSQVSLLALIEPSSRNTKIANADRLRVVQQRVDYVVCDPAGAVLVVIELDDRTHERKKDAIRDKRLKQAGIATLRYQSKAKPSVGTVRSDVLALAKRAAGTLVDQQPVLGVVKVKS